MNNGPFGQEWEQSEGFVQHWKLILKYDFLELANMRVRLQKSDVLVRHQKWVSNQLKITYITLNILEASMRLTR